MISVDSSRCSRCGECVRDCIVHVLRPGEDGVPCVLPEEERFCLNCQHCLAVCPWGAVSCNGVSAADAAPIGTVPSAAATAALLRQRRSCRQWRDAPIDEATWKALQDALAWTPTGCNVHSLRFTLVRDRGEMDFFRGEIARSLKKPAVNALLRLAYSGYRRYLDEIARGEDVIFRNAPHMIVASVPRSAPCREADPWIALSYFDVLAQSLGLGTCWCGFGVHAFKWVKSMRARLALPKGYEVGAVLLFGRPGVDYRRQTRPAPMPVDVL